MLSAPEPMPDAPHPPMAVTVPPVIEIFTSVSAQYFRLLGEPTPEPMPAPPALRLLLSEYPIAVMSPPVISILHTLQPLPLPIPAEYFPPSASSMVPPLIFMIESADETFSPSAFLFEPYSWIAAPYPIPGALVPPLAYSMMPPVISNRTLP